MQAIQDCKVSKNQNGYIITVYLDKQSTEFANELGTPNTNNNNGLKQEVNNYVSKKFPQIKNATVKLMVGTMLVGSFAYAAPTLSAHAAGDVDGTTGTAQTEDGTTQTEDGTTPGGGDDAGDDATPGDGDDAGDDTTTGDGDDEAGTPTGTEKLKDVAEGKFYTDAVYDLIERGIITGYPDGTFKPGNEIKRAEFVNLLAKALDLDTENAPDPEFKDVTNKDAYYYGAVAALVDAGILTGYEDDTFRPNNTISRAEIAKLLVEAYEELNADEAGTTPFTDVVKDSWYEKYVSPLVAKEITKGKTATTFAPDGKTTRGEAVTFIYRTLNLTDSEDTDTDTTAPTVATASTDATIAVGATTVITFSETLSAASKTAVETAVAGAVGGVTEGDLGFAWDDTANTLTITNNSATTDATFATDVTADITDEAGNTTTNATIIDVTPTDTTAPTVATASTDATIAVGATTVITFSETLSAASKTAVETAVAGAVGGVTGGDLGFAWDDTANTLTITNNSATIDATFATDVTADITDEAGNTTTNATIIDVTP